MRPDPKLAAARRGRQRDVVVGSHTYTIEAIPELRQYERATALRSGPACPADEWIAGYVVGWTLTDADFLPSGGPEPLEVTPERVAFWLSTHPDVFLTLFQELTSGTIFDATPAQDDALGNSGSAAPAGTMSS